MNVGTKSVLFGVHAAWWHPFTVAAAWRRLYGKWPTWKIWVAIFCHDIGYWGKPNMDGPEGRSHPGEGAFLARRIVSFFAGKKVGHEIGMFTYLHSRETSKQWGFHPSALCWADKFCCFYDPTWFYLLRAHLSGEIYEFRANAAADIPLFFDTKDWYCWYRLKVLWLPEIQSLLAQRRQSCIFPF